MNEGNRKKQKIVNKELLKFLRPLWKSLIFIFKNLLSVLISIIELIIKKTLEILETIKFKL